MRHIRYAHNDHCRHRHDAPVVIPPVGAGALFLLLCGQGLIRRCRARDAAHLYAVFLPQHREQGLHGCKPRQPETEQHRPEHADREQQDHAADARQHENACQDAARRGDSQQPARPAQQAVRGGQLQRQNGSAKRSQNRQHQKIQRQKNENGKPGVIPLLRGGFKHKGRYKAQQPQHQRANAAKAAGGFPMGG